LKHRLSIIMRLSPLTALHRSRIHTSKPKAGITRPFMINLAKRDLVLALAAIVENLLGIAQTRLLGIETGDGFHILFRQ
jgi:hypothetical protein